MKHLRIMALIAAVAVMAVGCNQKNAAEQKEGEQVDNIYQFSVEDGNGDTVALSGYEGKVLLVVNTATQCGFTPQYEELEALYGLYKDKGLEILDFPCNQFGGQAPGTFEEIHGFCTGTYGITFPQMAKVDVNGDLESPLFAWLKSKAGFEGFDLTDPRGAFMDAMLRQNDSLYDQNNDIKWNFTKFLIDRNGIVVARFEPTAHMEMVSDSIARVLEAQK